MKQCHDILIFLSVCVLSFWAGRCSTERCFAPDINVVTRADTISIRETLTIDRPVYINRLKIDTMLIAVRDTVIVKDTAYIVIEREQRHYRSMDYEAWVSGFRPVLDSIRVFPETKYITRETVSRPPPKRWGLGVQLGYGVGVAGGKVQGIPYMGVGISYNILQW
jgi:hypothetical protein|nr:MAG TPA: hypothetical protein [Caudoviricetes sp.]